MEKKLKKKIQRNELPREKAVKVLKLSNEALKEIKKEESANSEEEVKKARLRRAKIMAILSVLVGITGFGVDYWAKRTEVKNKELLERVKRETEETLRKGAETYNEGVRNLSEFAKNFKPGKPNKEDSCKKNRITTHDSIVNCIRTRKLDVDTQTKKAISEVNQVGRKSGKIKKFTSVAQEASKQIEQAKAEAKHGKPNKKRYLFIAKLLGVLTATATVATLLVRNAERKTSLNKNQAETLRRTENNISTINKNISKSYKELSNFGKVKQNLSDPNYVWDI